MKFLFTLLATLLTFSVAAQEAQQELLFKEFLKGYEALDSLAVLDKIEANLALNKQPTSIFLASATINPLAKAMLALEAVEGVRDRVRYRISYGVESINNNLNANRIPMSFIQVDRFSLGQTIRQATIEDYGEQHVAPPSAFDVGPHVSWRMVTQPVQGTVADIQAIGRTELSQSKALKMQCFTVPCLSLLDWSPPVHHTEAQPTPLAITAPFQVIRQGILSPAAAITQLIHELDITEVENYHDTPQLPEPVIEAIIDINLGQDTGMVAALRRSHLMDDSVSAIWRLISVMPQDTELAPRLVQSEGVECQRGQRFPAGGELCP
ncbi:hypothetical protein [Oceanisphaera avium]|uniref:Uncharacterized protein n=1 Tax=Oceanisphaera avium TaxID=1903694 RepID=A0A1Y0CXM9_9GAMM|nr:hypothetical protein [Oceanisphaera avium]ART79774.1 hypothetical protein CBP12_06075 [Oceanisphaera avium]